MNKILVVDDERSARESLRMIFKGTHEVVDAASGEEGLALFAAEEPQVVLLDIIMPGLDGIATLERLRGIDPDVPVIMITATQMVSTAVKAMKLGAFDYLVKPFDVEEIVIVVEKALERHFLTHEVRKLRSELSSRYGFDNIIGKSKEMQEIYRTVEIIAGKKATVLVAGESGTGKELIARAIHFNSPRAARPFISVNCAAIPEGLIESELFGHERGAFTDARARREGRFELADGGTLLLDEIGELSLATQAKILRAIQEREFLRVGGTEPVAVDVRLIAATNKDLERAMADGTFRSDLYYRLNVVPIHVPPLRQRKEDIPLLAGHFVRKYTTDQGIEPMTISPEAMDHMVNYTWPGNVRELENIIERLVALCPRPTVTVDDLPLGMRRNIKLNAFKHAVLEGGMSFEKAEREFQKDIILGALEKAGGVQTRAAELLGITRRMLKYRMDHLDIDGREPE